MEEPVIGTRSMRWQTYATAFVITALIFATAFYAANYFNNLRATEVRTAQDNVFIDILSLETQFALLASHSCSDISENSVLSREIGPVGERIAYLETQVSVEQDSLVRLKRYYSLLQIKDLLLMQEVSEKCGLEPIFILYFFLNKGDCKDCEEQGYVLTALSRDYPQLRVYSFDYNLENPALQTLIQINNVENDLPALVINGRPYYGLHNVEDIENILPELTALQTTESEDAATIKR